MITDATAERLADALAMEAAKVLMRSPPLVLPTQGLELQQ